jgi:hypothetical protein
MDITGLNGSTAASLSALGRGIAAVTAMVVVATVIAAGMADVLAMAIAEVTVVVAVTLLAVAMLVTVDMLLAADTAAGITDRLAAASMVRLRAASMAAAAEASTAVVAVMAAADAGNAQHNARLHDGCPSGQPLLRWVFDAWLRFPPRLKPLHFRVVYGGAEAPPLQNEGSVDSDKVQPILVRIRSLLARI